MQYRLLGFRISKGSFTRQENGEVVDYDNVIFGCAGKSVFKDSYGMQVFEFKIASRMLDLSDNGIQHLKSMIGKDVDFDFTPYGKRIVYTGISCPELNKQ